MGRSGNRLCFLFGIVSITGLHIVVICVWQLRIWGDYQTHEDVMSTFLQPQRVAVQPPANRTIVILMGNLRCGEAAWKTLYEHVLDINSADLALFTQEPPEKYRNASILDRAKYVFQYPIYEDWADAIDLINGTAWRNTLLPLYAPRNLLLGGIRNINGSGAIIFSFRWFVSQRIQQLGWTEQYDRFVISRNDHYYRCPHNLSLLDNRYMWVPEGLDWYGIADRHLVVNSSTVLTALDVLPPLIQNPVRYRKQLANEAFNTEQFLKVRWTEEGLMDSVKRFDRMMFLCGTPGDKVGWSKLGKKVQEGVHLKYPKEEELSEKTCHMSNSRQ